MPGGLTMIMCKCLKDWERRRKQTSVSRSAGNKLSFFQQVLSQASSYPQDNVCHAGEGEGVYCYMVKTNNHTSLSVLWYSGSPGLAHSYQYSICEPHSYAQRCCIWYCHGQMYARNLQLIISIFRKLSHTHILSVSCSVHHQACSLLANFYASGRAGIWGGYNTHMQTWVSHWFLSCKLMQLSLFGFACFCGGFLTLCPEYYSGSAAVHNIPYCLTGLFFLGVFISNCPWNSGETSAICSVINCLRL